MPKISVRPLFKLTKAQWLKVFERAMEKGEGKMTPEAGRLIMGKFEPPVERTVGTLRRRVPIFEGASEDELKTVMEKLPIAEARARFFSSPESYLSPTRPGPVGKEIRAVEPGSAEELAKGLAYERIKEAPIIPQQLSKGISIAGKEVPELAPKEALVDKARLAAVAEEIWRDIVGGGRSMGGRIFDRLRASSNRGPHIKTAKDYFTSSFVRWKTDAVKFKNAYPREAKILEDLYAEWVAVGGGEV